MKFKYVDKFLLAGFSMSVALSFVLFISGVDKISSVILGLLGMVITTLFDLIARTEKAIYQNNLGAELFKKLEDTNLYKDMLTEIIFKSSYISKNLSNEIFRQRAILEVQRLRDFLVALSNGQLITGFRENEIILSLIESTNKDFVVTSPTSTDDDWWDTPRGQRFWQANWDAINRGVSITRVFLFNSMSKNLKARMKEHKSAGIKVYWAYIHELPVELRVHVGVFDHKIGYELTQVADGSVSNYVYSIDQGTISKLEHILERLLFMAHEFDGQTEG